MTAVQSPVWRDVVIIGGCGRVGLPLALALSTRGLKVAILDVNERAVDLINAGGMPFAEEGAEPVLRDAVERGQVFATTDAGVLGTAEIVVIVVGTGVKADREPDLDVLPAVIRQYGRHLRGDQLIILRSTVFPGTTATVERLLAEQGKRVDVAFCPERTAEGRAMTELYELPQIIGARTPSARGRAGNFFLRLTDHVIDLTPEEAELGKLFANAWRYIKFAAANQFWMVANEAGVDFDKVRKAVGHRYERAVDMPGPGFAAGPCLPKDTMQLAAFAKTRFDLGRAALNVNENLPAYVVARLGQLYQLDKLTVGILGMAFKGDTDDARQSLSYDLLDVLTPRVKRILCADPYVVDPRLAEQEYVLAEADIIIIGAPHSRYRTIATAVPVVDFWNVTESGVRL